MNEKMSHLIPDFLLHWNW